MSKSKSSLPHESSNLFLTDGGLETTLVFLEGYDLPYFAAFDLLKSEQGYTALENYYKRYLQIAKHSKTNFILESPTWRANPDWIEKIGYPKTAIAEINEKAIQLLVNLKKEYGNDIDNILISGCIGPRGDGYKPENKMDIDAAQKYHAEQIEIFSHTPVDMISAITMNYVEEAIGITRAAHHGHLPVVISFTLETDGKLATGMRLEDAIRHVDDCGATPPLYFMINCSHPTHFLKEIMEGKNEPWTKRIKGVRANASCKSHAELDEATILDRGNPQELGQSHKLLKSTFTHLNVFGGCCGTDEEHVLQIINQVTSV